MYTGRKKEMLNNMENLITILTIIIIAIIILIAILAIVYFSSKKQKENGEKKDNVSKAEDDKDKNKKSKTFAVESVMDFMEFDKIEDNMIVQKNGTKYIMVVECQGINYDLMSELEKNSVEESFIQFLNTIRHPIQIYVQTRTINLENSIQGYKDRVKQIEDNLNMQEIRYKEMASSGRYSREQLNQAYYELTKQRNLAEYGKDIIFSTEKMSLNKNVLNQKYYIVVPYYPEELGQNDFDKEEIKNLAFSELYTRCQSMLRTLSGCGINGKVLSSNELADLLYVAYNRDEQETYGIGRALMAGYDELYSTAPDVINKKMRAIDAKIEEEAFNKANEKVIEVQTAKEKALKKKEDNMDSLISQMAQLIIEQNRTAIGNDVADEAIEKVKADDNKKKENDNKGGTEENVKEKTTKRRRTTKTA